jgi:3-oxoacyl-[acyl-carrier-protein] synthase III
MNVASVRVVGAGGYVPRRVVKNERLAQAIPGWPAERITERTGIEERRYLWDFDEQIGKAIPPEEGGADWPRGNVDMAEASLWQALGRAELAPADLDAIFLVTSTPDEVNFSRDAVELHRRIGARHEALALVVDSGCGGAVYVADLARKMILSGTARTVAICASTLASPYLDRDVFTSEMPGRKGINAFLSIYLFGDGAGALVLRGDSAPGIGILASTSGTDHAELVVHRGGGAKLPPHTRACLADHAWYVDGREVAVAYPLYMQKAVSECVGQRPELAAEIGRYYLHQASRRTLDSFVTRAGLPKDKVPVNVHRYGNTSAASTLLLFSEDLGEGRVKLGSGELVLFAAVGAGIHYGAHLVRL